MGASPPIVVHRCLRIPANLILGINPGEKNADDPGDRTCVRPFAHCEDGPLELALGLEKLRMFLHFTGSGTKTQRWGRHILTVALRATNSGPQRSRAIKMRSSPLPLRTSTVAPHRGVPTRRSPQPAQIPARSTEISLRFLVHVSGRTEEAGAQGCWGREETTEKKKATMLQRTARPADPHASCCALFRC
jgi:hypothetical protein